MFEPQTYELIGRFSLSLFAIVGGIRLIVFAMQIFTWLVFSKWVRF